MFSSELRELERKFGEPVRFCEWCQTWKPFSKMYKSRTASDGIGTFMGLKTCNSCHHKFRKIASKKETAVNLLAWLETVLGKYSIHIQILEASDEARREPAA